ncbi:MAG: phosphatase PAP2 family protein [Candidatus Njordarchaeota archaeon]
MKFDMDMLRKYWYIKNTMYIVLYALIALFLYDVVAEIHIREPTTLFTPLDDLIGFNSFFVIFYVFIFYPFFIFTFGYFIYVKTEKADQFFVSLLIIYSISYIVYIIFPVMMIRPDPDTLPKDFLSQVMAQYYRIDPPLNCFPSLHAALSSIAAYYLSKEKPKYALGFWFVAFMVMLSTLFVRQHVIVDEIAGCALAIFAGWISERKIPLGKKVEQNLQLRIIITIVLASLISFASIYKFIP